MQNKLKYEIIRKKLVANNKVLNVYDWGGCVYGVHNENSDYDLVIIVTDDFEETFNYTGVSVNVYTISEWKEMEIAHSIEVLECYCLDWFHIHKAQHLIQCDFDSISIRKTISKIASNAWSKGRKKLIIEKDFNPYIAKKSIWHTYRVLLFGIQIMKYGKINDYSQANDRYEEIVLNESNDWLFYKEKYQPIFNQLKTEFKKYSQEEWFNIKNAEVINENNISNAN